MKIIIFGATGTIGKHLITQALEAGHRVTAVTREPEKYTYGHHEALKVVKCDVRDSVQTKAVINGHEAVICALGMPLNNKDGLRAKGTKNIIAAMQSTSVARLVCLSGLGVSDSRKHLPFHYKYLILPLILRHVYADHAAQETHIRNSTLDWVIVRPANFSKGKPGEKYWHGTAPNGPALKLKIHPADVAHFMLGQLADDTYLHQAPGLSY